MAVRLGAGDRLGRDVAAGTGAVLDVELLAERNPASFASPYRSATTGASFAKTGIPSKPLNRVR
jgi:hypothetical protein